MKNQGINMNKYENHMFSFVFLTNYFIFFVRFSMFVVV